MTEVLQGFRQDADYQTAKRLLTSLTIYDLLGTTQVVKSADNYRALRKRGITVRKTADVIIAKFCIEQGHALLWLPAQNSVQPQWRRWKRYGTGCNPVPARSSPDPGV